MEEKIKSKIEEIERRLEKIEGKIENKTKILPQKSNKEKSLREFINEHKEKSDNDKTLLILYFLENFRKIKDITTIEISQGFKEIREKVPKNIADKFQKLAKKGYIMSSPCQDKKKGKNTWTYTNSGEEYVLSLKK